jgi:FkbM family methyltransferase
MSVILNDLISSAYNKYGMMQMAKEVEDFSKFFRDLDCKNIMEIGTYAGGLFSIMCKLSNHDGIKISVDLPVYPDQENTEYYKNFIRDYKTFSGNVHYVSADSHKQETLDRVKEILNGQELDFLFIDGDHSYEGVKKDFHMYKDLVKDGGYIGFHDINDTEWHRNLNCYVGNLWNEIKNEYESMEFNTNSYAMGIGVIQVFKHRRKLDVSVTFEAPNKIHINNNSLYNTDFVISVRDKRTLVPIYFCDISFSIPGLGWWIAPMINYDWETDPYCEGFIIEFYDKNHNFVDSKEITIKKLNIDKKIGTQIFLPFDCLWINYKQMFLEGIYDSFDMDNLNVVLDVGANVGMFTNYISLRNAKTVHAIEPNSKAFEQLKKQFYYQHGVKLHKVGLDTEDGQKLLYTNNENSTISSFLNKTSSDISEELIDMYRLPTFCRNLNISKVDLIKMDIEGMEYGIFDSLSDTDILMCDRYLVEYHLNSLTDNKAKKLITRLERLGYDVDVRPDNVEDTQGFFFAKIKEKTKILFEPTHELKELPKKAFVTLTNEYYLPITERLVKSLQNNSNYPIIVYSVNCDVNFTSPNMFTKRIDSDLITMPKFDESGKVISHRQGETVEVVLPSDSMGIVNRNDLGTYVMLSRKPVILLDAINNGLEEGIFLDADGIAKENIDTGFDYLTECEHYPLVGKGLYEYMMLNGLGDPAVGPSLEQPLMDLIGVPTRTMYYVSSNFILFTNKMKPFIEEWAALADKPEILAENLKYAPYHDETLVNVLLWKHNATKQLPRVHYNLTNAQKAYEFYSTNERGVYTDSDWHYIPENINDIKFFHGCKSVTEIDKTIELIESRKITSELNYSYKHIKFGNPSKIAIVTLFDKNYEDLANIAVPNFIEYGKKHGYDIIFFDDIIDKTRPPQWSKVKAVESVLDNYEWVWWIDIDALIINQDIKLESLIDTNHDIIFTANKYSTISNGSSFYRNCEFTKKFLRDCYELNLDILRDIDLTTFDHEQKPMRTLYLSGGEYASRINLLHERTCNSFWYTSSPSVLQSYPNWNSEDNIYQNGDFVVNFCGRTKDERIQIMKQFLQK